ncbi:SLBB domain-containing protein [Hahella sp. CR1]|uniref:SLBB domain-containing protein n=1 Tax=Hahella sp. CR1 TaxID=2992807 RepID=UPI002442D27B|nr:SLBB domain-containing protein [Hahella sp. CR1]MDG9667343.1 SLBB domain-containing protein [Hahella sp. CR1]
MHSMYKAIAIILLWGWSLLSGAQTLTQEQVQQFLSLPEAQQKALAQQYGLDINALKKSQATTSQKKLEPAPESPVRPLPSEEQERFADSGGPDSRIDEYGYEWEPDEGAYSYEQDWLLRDDEPPADRDLGQDVEYERDRSWSSREENRERYNKDRHNKQYRTDRQDKREQLDQREWRERREREERRDAPSTANKIKPFGYDLFAGAPTTFAPVTEIPIPAEYIVGPGDTIRVQMFGKENQLHELIVTRDGQIQIPQIGPIPVAGLSFNELKDQLTRLIQQKFIGVESAISLGELRSIRVFILGEARTPGAYTVSSLSTMTNALFVSGGVRPTGSLRNIQLKRQGKLISALDLYDLLLSGDTSADHRLQPGDVIFIPPKGKAVGVDGYVQRPAVYELKNEKTISGVVELAGGLRAEAYPKFTKVERVADGFKKTVQDVNLLTKQGERFGVKNGDLITVGAVDELVEGYVKILGEVSRPGVYDWSPGMRVSDVLHSIKSGLKPLSDLEYALIVREKGAYKDIEVIHVKLGEALSKPSSAANVVMMDKDRLLVFDRYRSRSKMLAGLLRKLKAQSSPAEKEKTFSVLGTARLQGKFPLPENYSVKDAIIAAGGIDPAVTDLNYALLIREVNPRGDIAVKALDLVEIFSDKRDAGYTIKSLDKLILFNKDAIREPLLEDVISRLREQARPGRPPQYVTIGGAVKFPGSYPVTEKFSIDRLIRAAGGLLDSSYTLQAEISRINVSSAKSDLEVFNAPVNTLTDGVTSELKAMDKVFIKTIPEYAERYTVTLEGEVQFPGEYVVRKGETLSQVIERAGGFSSNAFIKGAIYTRERLAELEAERLKEAEARLKRDLASLQLQLAREGNPGQEISTSDLGTLENLLSQVKESKPLGRLVIDLNALMQGDKKQDVILQEGDRLIVPPVTQSVTVIGEVQFSTSHIFYQNLSVEDYIKRSGGETAQADAGRTYVVRANGSVWLPGGSPWFSSGTEKIGPGDTIVVPLETDRLSKLQLWTNVSQIFYQIALGAAAVASL